MNYLSTWEEGMDTRVEERRTHQRFKMEQTCFINHQRTVGTIVDLSMGGLSCICLDQGECSQDLSTTISIYCKGKDVCADQIRMKVLSTEKKPGRFLEDLGLRKCRAKFCELDTPQKNQLESIIVNSSIR